MGFIRTINIIFPLYKLTIQSISALYKYSLSHFIRPISYGINDVLWGTSGAFQNFLETNSRFLRVDISFLRESNPTPSLDHS